MGCGNFKRALFTMNRKGAKIINRITVIKTGHIPLFQGKHHFFLIIFMGYVLGFNVSLYYETVSFITFWYSVVTVWLGAGVKLGGQTVDTNQKSL